MCVGSPAGKMWIDGCEMKQGSATGTSKVTAGSSQADHKAAAEAEVQAGCKLHQGQGSPPSATQWNLKMPWYLPQSRQAVRVNH